MSNRTAKEANPEDPIDYLLEDFRFHGKSECTRE